MGSPVNASSWSSVLLLTSLLGCGASPPPAELQRFVFVSEMGGNTIAQVDPVTSRIVGRWQVGTHPEYMGLDEQRHLLYVAVDDGDQIGVFDTRSLTSTTMSVAGLGSSRIGMTIAGNGTELLVSTRGPTGTIGEDNTLDIVKVDHESSPPTGTLVHSVHVGPHPLRAVVKGPYVVISALGMPSGIGDGAVASCLTVLDSTNGFQEVKRFLLDTAKPEGIDVHPTMNIAYVALHGTNEMAVLDLDQMSLTRVGMTSSRGNNPAPSVGTVTPDGRRMFVSAQGTNTLLLFDLSDPYHPTQDTSVELMVGIQPHDILWLDDTRAYVANTANATPDGSLALLQNYAATPTVDRDVIKLDNPLSMVLAAGSAPVLSP